MDKDNNLAAMRPSVQSRSRKQAEISTAELYKCGPKSIWAYVKTQDFGFWAICAYLIFEYVRPQTIYPVIDFLPWTQLILIYCAFRAMFEKDAPKKGNSVNKLMVVYGLVVLLSAIFAEWPSVAFDHLSDYWLWVLVFFAIIRIVNTPQRFFVFLLLYLLCNFKMSQHGFTSWAMRGFAFTTWGVTGSPGWFHNSGEFGIQLTIFIPLSMAFIAALKSYWGKYMRWFFYLMPVTAIGSVIATSSRGAMAGLFAALLWTVKSSKRFFRALFGISIVLLIVWWALPEESKQRFSTAGEDKTSTHRLDRWEAAWNTTLERPIMGVGHKNWDAYFRRYLDRGQSGSAKVHNFFVESMVEHGFVGLFVLIILLLSMFRLNAKTRKLAKQYGYHFEHAISKGLDAGLIGLMVSGSFITVLYYPYIWVHAAFVVALYNSALRRASSK